MGAVKLLLLNTVDCMLPVFDQGISRQIKSESEQNE